MLIELFMWSIMTWVVDRCKEDTERFPLYLLARAVKAVKIEFETNKSACKIASGLFVVIGSGDPAAFHARKYLGERIIATPRKVSGGTNW